ncbi:MAG TPA: HEAT repeat domain-containing protein [Bryobacteraceae bacterium]|nr:HEAT repeat domain-containing protein [Bryobacteraceae bacterium]
MSPFELSYIMNGDSDSRKLRLVNLRKNDHGAFGTVARQLASGEAGEEGLTLLSSVLIHLGRFGSFLRTELLDSPQQAQGLLSAGMKVDPHLDVSLCHEIACTNSMKRGEVLFLLDLLEKVSNGRRLSLPLSRLNHHPDTFVRSKAAHLFGAVNASKSWLSSQLRAPDPRVRANAIEGCLPIANEELVPILMTALRDPHHRVRATAALALHPIETHIARSTLMSMLNDPETAPAAAAAWAIAYTGDATYVPALKELLRHPDPARRYLALRPLRALRNAGDSLTEAPQTVDVVTSESTID